MRPRTKSETRSPRHPRYRRPPRRGFSLMELLIVIMILLALGGIVLVGYMNISDRADQDLQLVQFDQVDAAIKRFRLDLRRWPTEDEGLEVLWLKDSLEDEDDFVKWRGPYLEKPITEDTWGSEIVFRNPSEERGEGYYDIVSSGPDREEGTDDDITNHDRLRDETGEIGEEFDDFEPADVGDGG